MADMGLKCREAATPASDAEETEVLVMESTEVKAAKRESSHRRVRIALGAVALGSCLALIVHSLGREMADAGILRVTTWNIAAVNNNPFEYWITHADADYAALMENVQKFIDAPEGRDVPVSQVFTEESWQDLKSLMVSEGWKGIAETEAVWRDDYSSRKIISAFLKDAKLGEKRLASMPDRVTNTISTADQGPVYRPTVINCFEGDLGTLKKWWKEWKTFMFNRTFKLQGGEGTVTRPVEMLLKIKRSKYPALTAEEEAISVPLQTLAQAIFDAVLVHIVNSVSAGAKWQVLRSQMCDALNKKKGERTLQVLTSGYADSHILFLQETGSDFVTKSKETLLDGLYTTYSPAGLDGKRDQNSLILLRSDTFVSDTVTERTADVMAGFDKSVPVALGDLIVLTAADSLGRKYVLASFHGDTNGLATRPVLAEISKFANTLPDHTLIFGLDANTYEKGSSSKQDVLEFASDYVSRGYTSCWGDIPDPKNHTTFNARTFLQAQLQKAARSNEKISKGDKNPKDFIIFPKSALRVISTTKDNTGKHKYIEDMVFPTLAFPSDHGILSTTLQVIKK